MDLLAGLLAREQRALLMRRTPDWDPHLARCRAFLARGMEAGPVLVLGAGSGLDVPWGQAPKGSVGWDADPWSRLFTLLRHHRWVPWVFEDLTGGLDDLARMVQRNLRAGEGPRWRPDVARARVAGLLGTLEPRPSTLEAWVETHKPSAILAANVLGQLGPVARRMVGACFGKDPFHPDPDLVDPLEEAVDAWAVRAAGAVLGVLAKSGRPLWLIHDRAVLGEGPRPTLGPWDPDWRKQLTGVSWVEAMDPLPGLDVEQRVGRPAQVKERWFWPVAPDQLHLVEAMAFQGPR